MRALLGCVFGFLRSIVIWEVEMWLLTFEVALHAEVGNDFLAGLLFEGFTGHSGNGSSSGGGLRVFAHGDGVFLLSDVGGGKFCQHVHDELLIGHIVTKVLFVEALEVLVFFGGQACPRLVDDVGEGGVTGAFFYSMFFPLVGEVFADLDGLEALVDPVVGITEALEVLERLLDAEFRVLHLVDAVGSHLCEPTLEGFGLL